MILDHIEEIVFAGVAGYMWVNHFTMPGEVAGWFRPFVLFLINYESKNGQPKKWQHWAMKITFDCAKCVTGFWTILIMATLDLSAAIPCGVLASFLAELLTRKV